MYSRLAVPKLLLSTYNDLLSVVKSNVRQRARVKQPPTSHNDPFLDRLFARRHEKPLHFNGGE